MLSSITVSYDWYNSLYHLSKLSDSKTNERCCLMDYCRSPLRVCVLENIRTVIIHTISSFITKTLPFVLSQIYYKNCWNLGLNFPTSAKQEVNMQIFLMHWEINRTPWQSFSARNFLLSNDSIVPNKTRYCYCCAFFKSRRNISACILQKNEFKIFRSLQNFWHY